MKSLPLSRDHWRYLLIGLALLGGFLLSIAAWLRVCSESCVATHNYRFFGIIFEPVGLTFFGMVGILHLLSRKYRWLTPAVALIVFGALGAEIMLIIIQKYEIGHWCPICLSIASCLLVASTAFATQFLGHPIREYNSGDSAKTTLNLMKITLAGAFMAIGFLISLSGVSKEASELKEGFARSGAAFGNQSSPIDVYIITDWFCPGCHALEPVIEKMYPQVAKNASITFVDFVIHPESINYIPYNLSFMIHEKAKYLQIRNALLFLTHKTKEPSEAEVEAAVAPLKVTYHPLNYSQVDSGMHYFEGIIKTYGVQSTPSVVIVNHTKNRSKLIHGSQISQESILNIIKELSEN